MKDKQNTYSKQVIEIADYIYANSNINRKEVLAKFGKKWQTSIRTLDRWLKEAKEYNSNRLLKLEAIRDEILTEQTKEAVKSAVLSRNRSLEILSNIAEGNARKIGVEVVIPTDSERTKAIQQIAKMEGWEAPEKKDITVREFDLSELTPEQRKVLLQVGENMLNERE
ncbi:MAG: hypothetical protein FWF53_05605 [Candidatus Azobacteroides sp.]|nr:hypothetical protein [Candidatus Azobacteroides sp.]